MNGKTNFLSILCESIYHFLQRILSMGDSQPVARNNNDTLRFGQKVNGIIDICHGSFTFKSHCFATSGGFGSEPTKDDTDNITVHSVTHNLGECRTRASNQGTNCRHDRHIQHEPFGTESPSGIRVQPVEKKQNQSSENMLIPHRRSSKIFTSCLHCDNNWHISTTDGCSHMPAESPRCTKRTTECRHSDTHFRSTHNDGATTKSGRTQSHVDLITTS
mmetsp:Transcript_34306/g.71432  ORF Transcript_34306/g.71432 Transcript_34306/m.71432 type:complete len:218 (-) Transcript_34306:274-927(-)